MPILTSVNTESNLSNLPEQSRAPPRPNVKVLKKRSAEYLNECQKLFPGGSEEIGEITEASRSLASRLAKATDASVRRQRQVRRRPLPRLRPIQWEAIRNRRRLEKLVRRCPTRARRLELIEARRLTNTLSTQSKKWKWVYHQLR